MNEEQLLRAYGMSPTLVREAFGRLAPCRSCDGRGKVKHQADPEEAKERSRRRRQGQVVPEPPPFDTCVACDGRGYLPVESVDQDPGTPPLTGSSDE